MSDLDGQFSLDVLRGASCLLVYRVCPTGDPVGNQNNLRILLREDTQALDEVVIVGTGCRKIECDRSWLR